MKPEVCLWPRNNTLLFWDDPEYDPICSENNPLQNTKSPQGGGKVWTKGWSYNEFLFMSVNIRPCDKYNLKYVFLKRANSYVTK